MPQAAVLPARRQRKLLATWQCGNLEAGDEL
jgi:hypothetical protein